MSMVHRFSFPSSDQKTTLAAYRTETVSPQALVQISHGMCEYFLRYKGFAEYLSANGFLVFGHDHLGHGHSAPTQNDLGFTSENGGADALVHDVCALCEHMKAEYPTLPVILLGHSMGSFIARAALEQAPDLWDAAVIMGTAGPDMPVGAGRALASMLIKLLGERHRSPLLRKISFAGYNKGFGKGCDKNVWLTRDGEVVKRYNADPFCNYVFTARAYHDLFTLIGRVSRREWAEHMPQKLPLLLVSGSEDPVGAHGIGVEKIHTRLQSAGLSDLTLRLYPDMRHEILNEVSHETVWSDLLQWMKKSVKLSN